ncbi:flavoprotein [Saccharopolyspora erythraea NRRL 2338]|uniref:Flavoprotein n=1 Tax=Saccharopolyspora erythraea (strain ATCC 11635 / DSM 40517 / JCM 4748 / NBRC 13426 / NCIMB 8594 / NRRL 2338) TaxID=405948 RepID=A4F8U8_SACEN|nr:flavoprotein [Saccharopolyspora erythraea NRRL 2338]CAM00473.1 flavoprotein [Saccharopolyspora erythraea NRRL 2338]
MGNLIRLLRAEGWLTCLVLSPTAAGWVDTAELEQLTGMPVRSALRQPTEQDPFPPADAVLAAPLTFNTVNKWAAGMNDTTALGVLNELLGAAVPIVAAPCVKSLLQSHPAYRASVERLTESGVRFLEQSQTVVRTQDAAVDFDWPSLVAEVQRLRST